MDNYSTDGNYPPGAANDPNAPWNEKETPEKEFEVCITQTLSKTVKVTTNDYIPDGGIDDDGHYYLDTDTSDTDWKEVYKDEHYTPIQLIKLFKESLQSTLQDYPEHSSKASRIKHLISECGEWSEDETEIVEE